MLSPSVGAFMCLSRCGYLQAGAVRCMAVGGVLRRSFTVSLRVGTVGVPFRTGRACHLTVEEVDAKVPFPLT